MLVQYRRCGYGQSPSPALLFPHSLAGECVLRPHAVLLTDCRCVLVGTSGGWFGDGGTVVSLCAWPFHTCLADPSIVPFSRMQILYDYRVAVRMKEANNIPDELEAPTRVPPHVTLALEVRRHMRYRVVRPFWCINIVQWVLSLQVPAAHP